MRVIDPGHRYGLWQLGGGEQELKFVKRSGGAITHPNEHPGVQTQEVLRALIDRTKYLNDILPCVETKDALHYLQMALYMYEVRAWRRKLEQVNTKDPSHNDSERPRSWRDNPFSDIPFNEIGIEHRPIGDDGHIVVLM